MNENEASAGRQTSLNMGRTCSECVVEMNAAVTWLTASINAFAVDAIDSISFSYSFFLSFSVSCDSSGLAAAVTGCFFNAIGSALISL